MALLLLFLFHFIFTLTLSVAKHEIMKRLVQLKHFSGSYTLMERLHVFNRINVTLGSVIPGNTSKDHLLYSSFLGRLKKTPRDHHFPAIFTFVVCRLPVLMGNFSNDARRRQRERQKSNRLLKISKTTTLHVHHTFWYISLPSLHV